MFVWAGVGGGRGRMGLLKKEKEVTVQFLRTKVVFLGGCVSCKTTV